MCRKNKEIGKRIKELRAFLGLTQREFADRIYSSYRSVQNWESGDRNISESNLRLLMDEYGVSADWIYSGSWEMFFTPSATEEASIFTHAEEIIKIPLTVNNPELYAFIVTDDTMSPIISSGDIVLWSKECRLDDGSYLVFSDNQNRPFIRRYNENGSPCFISLGISVQNEILPEDSAFTLIGTVVSVMGKKPLI